MRRLLFSMAMLGLTSALAIGATTAYFSDTESVKGNTFTAGTLDLEVDDGVSTAKFTVANMKPGSQSIGTWKLKNTGTINGFIDIKNIVLESRENNCTEVERSAGDTTCYNPGIGNGELEDVVSVTLFWDQNCNGRVGTKDVKFYDGKVSGLKSYYNLDRGLSANQTQCVTAQFNWRSGTQDNLAHGDSFTLDLDFELSQVK